MGSFCTYQGIVGIHTSEPYIYSDKRRYWKHDAVVPVVQTDVPVDVLTFGGEAAAMEGSIYYVTARTILQPNPKSEEGEFRLQLYANTPLQPLPPNARAVCALTISGKVSQGSAELEKHRGFNIDVSQFGAAPHQSIRLRCYFPSTHPRLTRTPLPSAGRHVIVQGCIQRIDGDRCIVSVNDIKFGASESIFTVDTHPPTKLSHFDWSTKGKGKRARYDSNDDKSSLIASSSQTIT
ncbi:hypothetical protein SCLCIDRAFT_33946 [Scleroderma citrinum Foug A]|uniref:Uncharacterized protein n=1 Tax=Scleroderma citrinum Foug A TaxID=1036808 RepID=A0A0C3CQG7_9AGAM|nr:hypothetical protein SCLCIDRAFT_33946 [Scleroderma citrinum Foug A]